LVMERHLMARILHHIHMNSQVLFRLY
jgi:hypothetical protein